MGEQLVVELRGQKLSLYVSIKDRGESTCYWRCAKVWPPLIDRGQVVVANRSCHRHDCRIDQAQLGTVKRKGGSLQITYYGHPLYRYRRDTKTGQALGQSRRQFGSGFGAILPDGTFYCWGLQPCSP